MTLFQHLQAMFTHRGRRRLVMLFQTASNACCEPRASVLVVASVPSPTSLILAAIIGYVLIVVIFPSSIFWALLPRPRLLASATLPLRGAAALHQRLTKVLT